MNQNLFKNFVLSFASLLMLMLIGISPTSADEDWTQWRGPHRDGQITNQSLPARLNDKTVVKNWRVELGPSYSGPIVVGDRVFVTETKDKKNEVVRALDRSTGEQIWETQWAGAMKVPFFARANGDWIRSTPAYDQGRLYVGGMLDVLICLDAESGEQIWKIDFPQQLGSAKPTFGFVSSPLVEGDAVYVQAGGAFCKIDKSSGKIIWRTLEDQGGMMGSAFSSPYLAEINGQPQLLVQTRQNLAGVDPQDGKVLWSQPIPTFRGMNILTPTVYQDSVFTSAYGGRAFLYRLQQSGDQWKPTQLWENRTQAYMSSPIIHDGHAYLHLRNQRFRCIDLATGETKWTSETYGKYASLVIQDDTILALDQRGELLMFKANSEQFELIDQMRVSDQETWAHIAVSKDDLFVRELNAISNFKLKN